MTDFWKNDEVAPAGAFWEKDQKAGEAASQPGVLEDAAKGGASGLAQGIIGLPGAPGDIQQVVKAAADKTGLSAQNPLGWVTHKLDENFPGAMAFMRESNKKSENVPAAKVGSGDIPGVALPSSSDIQGQVEKVTGPFYQAQTPVGKAVQTATQVAPALATGGEVLPGLIAKSAGAGAASELAGEGADKLKGYLPKGLQPYAEPVARAAGVMGGVFTPAAVRRGITPLPMEADQAATIAALKAKNPNFPITAGQMTNTPGLMSLEGRAPRFNTLPDKQADAFTRGTMQEMGVDGLATPENIAKGSDIGDRIGAIRRGNEITPAEFPQLNQDITKEVRAFAAKAGVKNAKGLTDLQNEIRLGAANNPNVASMPGGRYNYMRQRVQDAIDSASTGDEKTALANIRSKMDEAFHRSITPDQSAELKNLETQYANYNVLKNKNSTAAASGTDTVTPAEVSSAVAKNFGNAAVNENRGTLAPWARNASKVMKELPETNAEGVGSPMSRLTGSILGGVFGGGAAAAGGHAALDPAIVGAILGGGHGGIPDLVQVLKNGAGRFVSTPPVQKYLGNQMLMPGQNTSSDPAMMARLLMSPPVEQLPNGSK